MLILEHAVEFIADDELMKIAPRSIHLRKRLLKEHGRRRTSREGG
jgi:GTP-binding protein